MQEKTIMEDATPEEINIIKAFFSGKSIDALAREYAATHITTTEKGTRTNMRVKEAYPIIAAALQKIKWEA